MIRVLLVADTGRVMADLTESLWQIPGVDIAGHANGRSSLAAIVRSLSPDVVLVDQMCWTGLAITRIAEVRATDEHVAIVALTESDDADWVPEGIRAGAAAVVPRQLSPQTLGLVLDEARTASPHPRHQLPHSIERSAA